MLILKATGITMSAEGNEFKKDIKFSTAPQNNTCTFHYGFFSAEGYFN